MQLDKIVNVPELLKQLSPSGTLTAIHEGNPELDRLQDEFDTVEARVQRHLAEPSLISRLEDDFARCVPSIADAAIPLEQWAIPLLSALAGPMAPFMSFGLQVAVKVALFAMQAWASKRLAGKV